MILIQNMIWIQNMSWIQNSEMLLLVKLIIMQYIKYKVTLAREFKETLPSIIMNEISKNKYH